MSDKCRVCGLPLYRKEHKPGWQPSDKRSSYFTHWMRCKRGHVFFEEKNRVWVREPRNALDYVMDDWVPDHLQGPMRAPWED